MIFILCNIYFYYILFYSQDSKSTDTYADYLYYIRKQSLLIEHQHEGQLFPSYITCGTDTSLIDLSKTIISPTLVYYFPGQTCPPCLETIRDSIEKNFPDYQNKKNILFMSNNLEKVLYNNYLGKKIIKFYDKQNSLFSNCSTFPMFFILDSDMKIQHLFVIDKQTPMLTSYYLKIIKQRYFDNN